MSDQPWNLELELGTWNLELWNLELWNLERMLMDPKAWQWDLQFTFRIRRKTVRRQVAQPFQSAQMRKRGVCQLGIAQTKLIKIDEIRQMGDSRVGDSVGVAKELPQGRQLSHRRQIVIGDVGTQIQISEPRQFQEITKSDGRDARIEQIDFRQIRQAGQAVQLGIVDARVAKIHSDDAIHTVDLFHFDFSAQGFDQHPFGMIGRALASVARFRIGSFVEVGTDFVQNPREWHFPAASAFGSVSSLRPCSKDLAAFFSPSALASLSSF